MSQLRIRSNASCDFFELGLKWIGLVKMWHLFSSEALTLASMPDMPFNKTVKIQFACPRARFGSNLADEERAFVKPCFPPPSKMKGALKDRLSGGREPDPVHARHRMSVAGASSSLSALCDSSELFPSVEPRGGLRPTDRHASRLRTRTGRTFLDRGRNQHQVGQDDGERQPGRRVAKRASGRDPRPGRASPRL